MGGKRTKKSGENLCIKHIDSLLKNKFGMLGDSVEGQNLSGWSRHSCFFQ